jgi:hypothetical protein
MLNLELEKDIIGQLKKKVRSITHHDWERR